MKVDFSRVLVHVDVAHLLKAGYDHCSVAIPTERVVFRPDTFVPLYARVFHTRHYARIPGAGFDDVRPSSEWHDLDKLWSEDGVELLVAEIWDDRGCDGHVEYWFQHTYRFLSAQEFVDDLRASQDLDVDLYQYKRFVDHYLGDPSENPSFRVPLFQWGAHS